MGRGFLSGIFWGGIVSVALLFVASQTVERQSLSFPNPDAVAVEVPGGSEFNQAREESDPVVPEADARPEGDRVSGVAVPDDSGNEPPVMDTSSLRVPVPSTSLDTPETLGEAPATTEDVADPERVQDSAVVENSGDALVQPENPGAAPAADTANVAEPTTGVANEDDAPVVATEQDTAPSGGEANVAVAPEAGSTPSEPETGAAPQVTSQFAAPTGVVSPTLDNDAPLPWEVSEGDTALDEAPTAPALPDIASEPSLPPVGTEDTGSAPEIAAVEPEEEALPSFMVELAEANRAREAAAAAEQDLSDNASVDEGTSASSSGGDVNEVTQPVTALTDGDSNFGNDREDPQESSTNLPVVRRFGDNSSEPEVEETALLEPTDTEEVEEPSAEIGDETTPSALQAFRSEFEPPVGVPLMSIVLVHQGGPALRPEVLEALDPQIAFAVDASREDAASVAGAYRDAGREVVMIPSLPAGATPQDIEQALTVNFERIPEAVAVMDVSGSSFQSDRAAVAQVVDVVSASGHGLITFPRGLNTAHQQAQRAGVPTGLIFRNLDGGGETQEQIRRGLDRAAFRARQDEAVILVATTGSTTLAALTEWALGNRAETVAIAPVSAALIEN